MDEAEQTEGKEEFNFTEETFQDASQRKHQIQNCTLIITHMLFIFIIIYCSSGITGTYWVFLFVSTLFFSQVNDYKQRYRKNKKDIESKLLHF